jgi:ATP-dependent helicase/nuclease subunit B
MPTIVHLAPVGAGKTEFALHRLLEFVHHADKPFLKTWILLATRRQEVGFRQRLVELQSESPVFFNVEFFNFYELNARLLNIAGRPPRKVQNSARVSILRTIVSRMRDHDELDFFHDIAHTPGFISVLANLIDELKQNSVYPHVFETGAQTTKDEEIAKIYHRYQDTLIENNLVDLEGEGWLALETIQAEPHIVQDVDLLLVDGYDQFTPVQSNLLAELSHTIPNIDITLTTVPDRGADYARRFSRALSRLKEAHQEAHVDFDTQLLERNNIDRHTDLDTLGQLIFQDKASNPQSDVIRLIEMPTPAEEVMAVLRAIKQQLFDGVRPDDILIALRDWTRYEAYFQSYQGLYNLPLLLHHHPAYNKTPIIAVLIDLLELAPDFRRRDLLDVFRSPYIDSGLTSEQVDLLDRITFEKRLVRGTVDDWLDVIEFASTPSFDEEAQEKDPLLTPDEANELSLNLQTFLEGITPPPYQDVESFVDWLEWIIGKDPNQDPDTLDELDKWYDPDKFTLNIATQLYEGDASTEAIVRRDISALNGMKNILRHMLTTDIFLRSTLNQETPINWKIFWSDLKLALQNTVDVPGNPSRTGRILVTTATDARGLPHQHVYVLGMAEGVFPAEVSEDPLYLDSERVRLQADHILLETQADRIDDQGLFYELISLPRQTLTLSRPTIQDGKVWIESHLWRAVKHVFPDLPMLKMIVGDVVHPQDAASHDELLLSVANQLNQSDASEVDYALRVQNWLRNDEHMSAHWSHILHGRQVDNNRLSGEPYDNYSGYLLHPDLQDAVAELLGTDRIWSATQLKDYGLCGFRFYAKRLLRLNEMGEPEEGYDILQLGSLNHKILEETYNQLNSDGVPIHPEEREFALSTLESIAYEWFEKAPRVFGFRESPMWESEKSIILNRLKALISLDFSDQSPLNKFGAEREIHQQELFFRDIRIPLADDIDPIRIRGFIDRVDRVGDKLLIVDYKTGSSPINTSEMVEGRDFQMMTYTLALMTILETTDTDLELAGGMFWHLRNLSASGVFDVNNADDMQAVDTAKQHIADNLKKGRAGQFAVHANHIEEGKCVRYCEFSHLCRMSVTNPYK